LTSKNADATLTPAMLALKRARAELVQRLGEAVAFILGAVAVTLVVTLREEGAKTPTFSSVGYTAWGAWLEAQPPELQDLLVERHCSQSEKIVAENVVTTRGRLVARQMAAEEAAKDLAEKLDKANGEPDKQPS
jgi:hypothetical protein